jgi:hypothetical protein
MSRSILYIIALLLTYGCSTNKPYACYEYEKNYKILFNTPPDLILKNNLELTKSERSILKYESPLPLDFHMNTCEGVVKKIEFTPEAISLRKTLAQNIDSSFRKKITQCLLSKTEIEIVPLREHEEVKCDSNIVIYLWVKYP